MRFRYKWRPSKSQIREFKEKMDEIAEFCAKNDISGTDNSYYFEINGKKYRVSNHTISASDRGMYDRDGNKVRDSYHKGEEYYQVIYASKTRIIEIYNALKDGVTLDGRGYSV